MGQLFSLLFQCFLEAGRKEPQRLHHPLSCPALALPWEKSSVTCLVGKSRGPGPGHPAPGWPSLWLPFPRPGCPVPSLPPCHSHVSFHTGTFSDTYCVGNQTHANLLNVIFRPIFPDVFSGLGASVPSCLDVWQSCLLIWRGTECAWPCCMPGGLVSSGLLARPEAWLHCLSVLETYWGLSEIACGGFVVCRASLPCKWAAWQPWSPVMWPFQWASDFMIKALYHLEWSYFGVFKYHKFPIYTFLMADKGIFERKKPKSS